MKTPILPKQTGDTFSLVVGDATLKCTTTNSGRITELSFAGKNILTDASVNPFNFGSTFWTAPQSDWDWPPPPAVDSEKPWKGTVENDAIVLKGEPCDKLNVQVAKRFCADAKKQAFILEYSVKNTGDAPRALAPWEISRVAPGGTTFYPQGSESYPPVYQEPLAVQEIDGITWFVHSDETVTGQHKLFADGKEGWIAHVSGDLLFIKSFEDQPATKRAPGEAEIEIYAVKEYVEVEQQGAFEEIAPGETKTWTVTWHLKKIPADISLEPGGKDLVSFVRSTVS